MLLVHAILKGFQQLVVEWVEVDAEDTVLVREEEERGFQSHAGGAAGDDGDLVVADGVNHFAGVEEIWGGGDLEAGKTEEDAGTEKDARY